MLHIVSLGEGSWLTSSYCYLFFFFTVVGLYAVAVVYIVKLFRRLEDRIKVLEEIQG